LLLLVVVALPVGAAVWLVFFARRGPSRRGLRGPVCGACGYNVLGLATMTCPECGGDLRVVGILTPRTPRRGLGGLAAAVAFTALLCFVAAVATAALLSVLPMRLSYRQHVRLAAPQSIAYQEVVFRTTAATWGTGAPALPVEVELVPSAVAATTTGPASTQPAGPTTQRSGPPTRPPRLTVRPDGGYEFTAPGAGPGAASGVTHRDGFGPQAVLDWMTAAGLDTSQRAINEEAVRISGEARLAMRGRWRLATRGGPGGYSSSSSGSDSGGQFAARYSTEQADRRQPVWAVLLFVGFWVAVWVAGLRHLATRAVPAPARARRTAR
jgi:hypothetical protein